MVGFILIRNEKTGISISDNPLKSSRNIQQPFANKLELFTNGSLFIGE